METAYTAIIQKDGDWWVGWVEEVPGVNAQEKTRDELLVSLKLALKDVIDLNRIEAREVAAAGYEEVPLSA